MELIFDIPDFIILCSIALGAYITSKNIHNILLKGWWYFFWAVTFGLILPLISSLFELQKHQGHMDDGFNLTYIWLRWPVYWFIGLLSAIALYLYAGGRRLIEK